MVSVHSALIRRLLRSPGRVAVRDDQRAWKRYELLMGAMHLAGHIRKATDTKHIGLMLPTSGLTPMAALACWIAGRVPVPLNYLLKPDELAYIVGDAGLDTIITARGMLDFLDEPPEVPNLLVLDELSFKGLPPLRLPARARGDDLASLLYTSGTSGKPKGVMLTHANILAAVRAAMHHATIQRDDVFLGILPQFHCFGLVELTLLPLLSGCQVVYTARFVPPRLLKLAREHKPTVFIAIPAMYNALAHTKSARPDDFASLRYCVSGGEPLPDAVAELFLERFGLRIAEGFGMTETSAATHWCLPQSYRPHSVGQPLPGIEQRIVDLESGSDLPAGSEGELRLGGPSIMKGYLNLPEITKAAFDDRGHLRTGDIARIDDDGHLSITGRLKEMMIVGGENVFPREIEEVLDAHPSVHASGVVGRRDPSRGEVPVAFVELVEDAEFDERALIAHCREHLPGYKAPRDIFLLEELPRNATGKVLRRSLSEQLPDHG